MDDATIKRNRIIFGVACNACAAAACYFVGRGMFMMFVPAALFTVAGFMAFQAARWD